MNPTEAINILIQGDGIEKGKISDGYHTFDELYDHRCTLFVCLCVYLYRDRVVWRSKCHADGSTYEDWFIMGIDYHPGQQISYHLPMKYWENTQFAKTLDKAPVWDGHTSADVIKRLQGLS